VIYPQGSRMLEETIQELIKYIDFAKLTADFDCLNKAHKHFKKLRYDSTLWKDYIKQYKIYQWGIQKDKYCVGAHLFYNKEIAEYLLSSSTEHLLTRTDLAWSLVIAAKYGHPLGQFYLAYIFDFKFCRWVDLQIYLCKYLYKQSITTLLNHKNQPEALFALGLYGFECWTIDEIKIPLNVALEYFKQAATDFEHRKSELYAIKYDRELDSSERIERFAKLGAKGYDLGYVEAAENEKKNEKKLYYLEKVCSKDSCYPPALVDLGSLYLNRKEYQKAYEVFSRAGKNGLGKGYIEAAYMFLGCDSFNTFCIPDNVEKEHFKMTIANLEMACFLHDTKALEHLVKLCSQYVSVSKKN